MERLVPVVAGILASLLLIAPAEACGPFRPFFQSSAPVIVEKKVIIEEPVIVPLFVAVPAYGVGYPPPPVSVPAPQVVAPTPSPSICEQRATDLEKRLVELEKRLSSGAGVAPGGNLPVAPQGQPAQAGGKDALSIFAAKCSSCHLASSASDKGGSFTLMTTPGKLAQLNDRQLRKIGTYTYTQRMPKGGPPLSDEEVATIQAWIDSQK